MRMMDGLRQAKHQAFLVSKKLRRTGAAAALRDADRRGARREEKHPFTYTEGMFPPTPSCADLIPRASSRRRCLLCSG